MIYMQIYTDMEPEKKTNKMIELRFQSKIFDRCRPLADKANE